MRGWWCILRSWPIPNPMHARVERSHARTHNAGKMPRNWSQCPNGGQISSAFKRLWHFHRKRATYLYRLFLLFWFIVHTAFFHLLFIGCCCYCYCYAVRLISLRFILCTFFSLPFLLLFSILIGWIPSIYSLLHKKLSSYFIIYFHIPKNDKHIHASAFIDWTLNVLLVSFSALLCECLIRFGLSRQDDRQSWAISDISRNQNAQTSEQKKCMAHYLGLARRSFFRVCVCVCFLPSHKIMILRNHYRLWTGV